MEAYSYSRFAQISNFRNIGVTKKEQTICINRSTESNYEGNLVLLIGPHNGGKTNLLDALNLLNENLNFNSNDLPNSIKNPNAGTFVTLYDVPSEDDEVITKKFTNGEKNPPRETFTEWKYGVRRWIESKLDKYMPNFGYKDQLQFIASGIPKIYWNNQEYSLVSNFFIAIDNWTFEDIIKNKWWEKDLGKMEFKSRTPYYNNSTVTAYETIFNQELIDYLNKLIELENQPIYPLLSNSTKTFNIRFYKYHPWKIDNGFFQTKYKGQWNEFFTNLFNKLGIKQQEIIHGIWGKQRYYEQLVKDGLKKMSDCFNSIFKASGYLYEFALFFNEETISFEINLVKQNHQEEDTNKIIPCIFEEQSATFRSFFNLYFGLLIGNTHHLKTGDVILMDEPISHLNVVGLIQLHDLLKKFTNDTGISIILSTQALSLIDYDYLDEIRLVDNINGVVNIDNYFQFNHEESSNAMQSILNTLITYPSFLMKIHHPVYIFVNTFSDYNYLTGYKLYQIKQLQNEIKASKDANQDSLKTLLHKYQSLIFIPVDFSKITNRDFIDVLSLGDDTNNNQFILTTNKNLALSKNINPHKIITYQELFTNLKDVNKTELTLDGLISKDDQEGYEIINDSDHSNYLNNVITFKNYMIDDKASKQTYENFANLFSNLLKYVDNKKQ